MARMLGAAVERWTSERGSCRVVAHAAVEIATAGKDVAFCSHHLGTC